MSSMGSVSHDNILEFKKAHDEFIHQKNWEKTYKSQTKEYLLNQLLEEQERDFPLKKGTPKEQKQFKALVIALEEKVQTSWLKEILKTLKNHFEN
jgi:hypothetical protein